MEKSQVLVDYLKKHCKTFAVITDEDGVFNFYKENVNRLPQSSITEGFMKIEDGYLKEVLKTKEIYDAQKEKNGISILKKEAAFIRADAVLSFVAGSQDKSVYLYGGTRLKTQVAKEIAAKNITVTKCDNLFYKGVVSARITTEINKITSVVLNDITEKYKYILDTAEQLSLKSLVLTVPQINNKLFEDRVATAIINEIKSHEIYSEIKIIFAITDETSFDTYEKKI